MINLDTIHALLLDADKNFESLSKQIELMGSEETTHEQEQYIAVVKQLLIYSQA